MPPTPAEPSRPTHTVMWFRRDLRLGDNPALLDACASDGVLPLFVLDPALWGPAGLPRRAYLGASLRALDASLRRRRSGLTVVRGDPVREVLRAAQAVGASRVHVAADFGPYGARRDQAVEAALAEHGIELVRTGSPYAVAPGRVTNGSGDPYKVYTPFAKAWADHGWRAPVDAPTGVTWLETDGVDIPEPAVPSSLELPDAGERAAQKRWRSYLEDHLGDYDAERDRPDLDTT
jgi:deoxyribodipyrimidine photo-lyase